MSLKDLLVAFRPTELVALPGGFKVEVRSLSLGERNALAKKFGTPDGTMNLEGFHAALVVATAYDPETGERLFSDGDHDAVNDLTVGLTESITEAALRVSGLTDAALDSGKAPS